MEKGKNGHLNPAFHLKVVGPINKAGSHKGVSEVCVCVEKEMKKKGSEECGHCFLAALTDLHNN